MFGAGARLCASTIALSSSAAIPKRMRESPIRLRIAISGTAPFHHENDTWVSPAPSVPPFTLEPSSGMFSSAPDATDLVGGARRAAFPVVANLQLDGAVRAVFDWPRRAIGQGIFGGD